MALELRTVFIDLETDQFLVHRAALRGLSKAEAFRRAVSVGIKRVRRGMPRPALQVSAEPLVLKTPFVEAKVADQLRAEAFDRHVPPNDVWREYLAAGLA